MGHPPRLHWALAFFVCFFVATLAAPTSKCVIGCHGMQPGKAYQPGHTYIYNLEGTSVTSVTEAQGEATLKLKAVVELTAKTDCIQQLRVKDVQINGAPAGLADINKYALQFNYHNGHIDSDVCAEAGDSQASLNIKRAVASLFQSAILQESGSTVHHETDVFGNCPTEFSFQKDGESLIVQKYRDLSQCSQRENMKQGLLTSVLNNEADVKASPLLASQQKIEQQFKKGILNKASSTETYKFRPFSNGDAGAKTVVETTLTLKGEKGDNPTAAVSLPKSLIFEAPHPVVKSSADAISNALQAAANEETDVVQPKAASKFAELVKVLRTSSKKDILSVYHKASSGAGFKGPVKKLLLDALFRTGSGEAVEVAVELIKNRELSDVQTYVFYASLPIIYHVNLPAVTAVTSLLNQPDLPRIGYLGIGQVIGKYCQQHPCENVAEVKEAVHKLREKVGNGKTKTRTQENAVVTALKALGNTRYLDDGTLQKLANIAADKNVRNRVRVAALETLPTLCSMKWKNTVFNVLADREEDSEVRIKTYLALVKCACPHVAEKLQEIIDKETVNQVGSFITSHLRNLRASTDPNKEAAKNLLGSIKPKTKFPEDFRKFSFNNELSYNLDAFGVGSSLERNVIYSQNSFVPRSTNLNLTAQVFGQSMNFFELDTRLENLDRIIEHYFGPKGVLRKDEDEMVEEATNAIVKVAEYMMNRYSEASNRGKREIKQAELDKFAKNVRLRGNEVDQDLNVDLSLKLFGVEVAYLTYHDDPQKVNPKQVVNKIMESLKKGLDKFKNFDQQLESHLHFLDAELVYPTGLGAPLSLGVSGTSVVHLKTKGKIDVTAIMKEPKNAAMRLAVEPSASIRIAGNIMLDAFGTNSGMSVVTTLHSAVGLDVSAKVLDGTGIDVVFGVPKRKQEVINVDSEILFTSGPKGENLVAPKFGKGKEYSDCFEQFSGILGVTVCGQLSFPYESIESVQKKPFYPLTGPLKFSLSMENNDVSSYNFKIYYNNKQPNTRSLEILLDTPNSKTNRRISLLAEGGLEPDKYVKLAFDSPIKKASLNAVLKNKPEERSLSVAVLSDQIEYNFRMGILSAGGNKYKPILEYKVPEHIEKLAFRNGVKSSGRGDQTYNLQGTVAVNDFEDGKKYDFENVALMGGGRKLVGLDGSIVATPSKAIVDTKLNYGEESLALKLDGKRLAERNYVISLSAVPSRDPNIGFNWKWEYNRKHDELDHKFVFIHGPDPNSEINRFTLKQHAEYKMDPKDFSISGKNELTYPAMNAVLKLEGKLTRKSAEGEIEIKYEKFKLGTEFSVKLDTVKPGGYEVELEAEILENKVELKSKRTILEPNVKSKFKNSLELSPGGKYEANGVVIHDISKNRINLQLDGDLNLNGKSIKVDTGLEATPTMVDSRAVLTVDGNKLVDFLLKGRGGPEPNGNLNLNLKNYLTATGQFSLQGGNGNGRILIDIPKYNRKIKGHGNLAITGTRYSANAELLYDADKDPNKRIKLTTLSDVTDTSVDTKNTLEVLSNKLEVNGKGQLKGKLSDGELNMEGDVTLPNGYYLTLKGTRVSTKKDDKYDVQVNSEVAMYTKKGGDSRKLLYKLNAKDVNPKLAQMQSKAQLKFVDVDGTDVVIDLGLKRLPIQGTDKQALEVDLDLAGSKLPKPFKLSASGDCNDKDNTYKVKTSLGDNLALSANGALSRGNNVDKPAKHSIDLEMKLPSEKLQSLKLKADTSLLLSSENRGSFEFANSGSLTYNNDKTIKLDASAKRSSGETKVDGAAKLSLTVLQFPPLSIDSTYTYDCSSDTRKGTGTLNLSYGDKNALLNLVASYLPDLSLVNVNAKATTTMEKLQNLDLTLTHKRKQDNQYRQTDIVLLVDNAKYTLSTEIQENQVAPMIHVTITCPNGVTELLAKFQKLGERDYSGEWKVETPKGFVKADARINLESVDDFVINLNFDSDKIKQRKIHAEIANKPTAKTGRRIIITVTSDGKNLITGSTNYKKREEEGKIVVEGNGNLKIGENTQSSSFKYTRQQLTREVDGEVGVAMVLNANFGPSAVVGEVKLTNKEVHVFNSYCEQSKDCAHFKLQATLDTDQKTQLKQQITMEVDLKKFNVPVEFGLQTSTQLTEFLFDHTASLYMHSAKDKSQYTYHLYMQPKECGAILTLPSREVALINTVELPKTKHTGAFKLITSFYLDRKNKPNEKTSISVIGDINMDKTLSVNSEAKFTYPSQTKDMSVKGRLHCGGQHLLEANLDIDLFAKKSQKINVVTKLTRLQIPNGYNLTGNVEVNSKGQQLKVELKTHVALSSNAVGAGSILSYTDEHQKPKNVIALFSANLEEAHVLITTPNKELIRSDTKTVFSKNLQKVDTELSILEQKPLVFNFEAQNMNSFNYLSYDKSRPGEKVTANGRIVLGQLAEIHADAYAKGKKLNLFHVLIHLDENKFLKPDFGYDQETIAGLLDQTRNKIVSTAKQLKDVGSDVIKEVVTELKDLLEHLKKAQPNLKPLLDYYIAELNKFKNELNADQTIQEIQANLSKRFGPLITTLQHTLKEALEQLEELYKQYNVIISKITDAIEATYPQLQESFNKLWKIGVDILDAAANVATTYLKAVLDIINKHQKEIKELAVMGTEIAQDVAKIIFKAAEQIRKDATEFVTLLVNQVKALPIYEILKEKYNEFSRFEIPEAITTPIQELCNAVKAMLPTPELQEFFSTTCSYIMKVIKRQETGGTNEIKLIYAQGIDAVKSLVNLVQSSAFLDNFQNVMLTKLPIDLSFLTKLPGISTLKLSIVNLLRNQELPTLLDVYYTYRPTWNLLDIVPPFRKMGIVADGGHIFTFDGRHITMPGSCNYILSQDMEDGNFSVIANFQNGNLNSITVTEPKESITMKSNGNILVNNQPAEFPASTSNLQAFLVKPGVNVKSSYGVHVTCLDSAPMICAVRVSGFYLGKLRGLLGDANNEPYDDFTLPSGKITEDETEFGNAYRLKASCPAATAVKHGTVPRAPVCTEYFTSSSSPLSACFNYVNPSHYRDACDSAISSGDKGVCLIAAAYHAACYEQRVFGTSIPASCGNCKAGGNQIAIGDSFSVKIPGKEADIIFVVEQEAENEKVYKEMIVPLMNELREELKQQGITDTHISLIGFAEHMKWPQHYTVNGDTNIEGEVKNIKFKQNEKPPTLQEAKEGNLAKKLEYISEKIDVELGTIKLSDAYEEVIRYPYRPGAAKAVVSVVSSPCEKSPFPVSLQQLRLLLGQKIYRDLGLTYYHVSFPNDILISGKPQKNVVGYDYENVYTFADSKKKSLEGNNELRNNMVLSTNDVCADFAISSGGAAFSSNNFLEAKPNQKKQFVQVAAKRIVGGLVNTEIEQDCVCEQRYGLIGQARCKIVGRKEKQSLTRHTKGGVKG